MRWLVELVERTLTCAAAASPDPKPGTAGRPIAAIANRHVAIPVAIGALRPFSGSLRICDVICALQLQRLRPI
jgi:hypothetical protein